MASAIIFVIHSAIKGNKISQENKRMDGLGENYDIEKIDNPDVNLFRESDYDLHTKRLIKFGYSKWEQEYYFAGERGGIYTMTSGGNRNYK